MLDVSNLNVRYGKQKVLSEVIDLLGRLAIVAAGLAEAQLKGGLRFERYRRKADIAKPDL
ncbi:hypothetical protein AS156_15195 [Bradyrhizobium macuxiense]|uniref:Uncharacterized protein n=1 Tax=Bradyrhizobium macuxiense TaxID=1755647 RepID=A0A109JIX8_9BRAD|nr:hypothetical protein [Bradyrhizobium macuxiense]KWV49872.1 hypothetical protein AS156_15195 [Bradyrhizobium macuxiense]